MIDRPVARRRVAALLALAAAVLVAAGCGGSSDDAAATTDAATAATTTAVAPPTTTAATTTTADGTKTVEVVVKEGVPAGGIVRATVGKGDTVALVVHSDVEDEVHLHGYNLAADVAAGGVARIEFVASVPGRFEAELEQRGVKIAELTVSP